MKNKNFAALSLSKCLLILSLFLITGCAASAQTDMKPLKKVVAYVDKYQGIIRLDPSHNSKITYDVPDGDYEHNKEYVFWLDVMDCHDCRTKKAVVVKYAITTQQAQRDQEKCAKELANRKIY